MTESSYSDIGRVAIDAYLDSVEQALITARAPRIDRLQVLQDLESQIADMLAQQPPPLTEQLVQSVIQSLEPPSHFAETYGSQPGTAPAANDRFSRLPRPRWPLAGAISCALLPSGVSFVLLSVAASDDGLIVVLGLILAFAGLVLTPFALWLAFRQLRAQQSADSGRDLFLKSTMAYGIIAPVLIMGFFAFVTEGYALVPFGVAGFAYFQYVLVRRLRDYMTAALPPSKSASTSDANNRDASSPIGSALTMPAL